MEKKGQAVQTKTVFIVIAVLVLVAVLFLIFQLDLFGYVSNLPSFGQVKIGEEEVELDDYLSDVGCDNIVGAISNKKLPVGWWTKTFASGGKDSRFFYFVERKEDETYRALESRKFVAEMEEKPYLLKFVFGGGTSKYNETILGVFDEEAGIFRATDEFTNPVLCGRDIFKETDADFHIVKKDFELGWADIFVREYNGCEYLQKLHGAEFTMSHVLCKSNEQLEKEQNAPVSEALKLINNYESLYKIENLGGEIVLELEDLSCVDARTNFLELIFYDWYNEEVFFAWDFKNNKVVIKSKPSRKLGKESWIYDYDDIFLKDSDVRSSFKHAFHFADKKDQEVVKKIFNSKNYEEFIKEVAGAVNLKENKVEINWGVGRYDEGKQNKIPEKEYKTYNPNTQKWSNSVGGNILDILSWRFTSQIEESEDLKFVDGKTFLSRWGEGGSCVNKEIIYSCYFDESGKKVIEPQECKFEDNKFCLIGENNKECGKACLCVDDYGQRASGLYFVFDNQKIKYLFNGKEFEMYKVN
jgi:hypothetical protein